MKESDKDPEFLQNMISLFENLGINSDTEQSFVNGVTQDYIESTKEILTLHKKEDDIIQLSKYSQERIKSKEEQEVSQALMLLQKEAFIYTNIIEKLNEQEEKINKLLKKEKNPKTTKILKNSLHQIKQKIKEKKASLEVKIDNIDLIRKQKKISKALKKIKEKKKEEIIEESARLNTGVVSKILLPGKWLDIYKDSVKSSVAKMEKDLHKIERNISRAENIKIDTKDVPKPIKNQKTKPIQKNTATEQKIDKVSKTLFKEVQIKGNAKVSTPTVTPSNEKLKNIRKNKSNQFIRKKS